ncbi:acyltransferase [bacterium]|nr:acyltransferase [bacterium]
MGFFGHLAGRLRDHWRRHRVNHLPFEHKGRGVMLFNGSTFGRPEHIHLGDNIYIGPEAYFHADGGIHVCDNVIMGPRVSIFTSNHKIDGAECLPFGVESEIAEVWIGPNAYIGAYSIILAGVRIGEGAVIAAGSVVTRNVPPLAYVAGNPARIIRWRDPKIYTKLKSKGQHYLDLMRGYDMQARYVPRPARPETTKETEEASKQRAEVNIDQYDFEG